MSACPEPSRYRLQVDLPTIAGIPAESQPAALRGLEIDVLRRRLGMVHARECASTAEILVHLIEVQRRRLYRSTACSCLYVYCQRKLRMSKAEAFRRTTAVRLGRRYPVILQAIADGRLKLTAVAMLSPHLKDEHVDIDEIVSAFAHKTIRDTQQLLAERFPEPDAPTVMRVLVTAVAANTGGGAIASGLERARARTRLACLRVRTLSQNSSQEELTRPILGFRPSRWGHLGQIPTRAARCKPMSSGSAQARAALLRRAAPQAEVRAGRQATRTTRRVEFTCAENRVSRPRFERRIKAARGRGHDASECARG